MTHFNPNHLLRITLATISALSLAACSRSAEPLTPQRSSFFISDNAPNLARIGRDFEVHHRLPGGFEIVSPIARVPELRQLAPDAELIERDVDAEIRNLSPEWLAAYHDFERVKAHLQRLAAEHPNLALLTVYGESKEGRPLYALKLSDNAADDEAEPEVMLTAATHGNELITVEVLLTLIDELVSGYGRDERLTRIVNEHEIFFLPVVNPDGYVIRSRYSNGVDPNREFPYPERPNRTPNPCIQNLMQFFLSRHIVRSIDFHSFGGIIMYPWSYTADSVPTVDATRFDSIASGMAASNGYRYGQIPKILYAAKGASVDFFFWKNATLAFGIEIGDQHAPPPDEIRLYVDQNRESTWRFLEF